jgi:hypothetical protein
MSEPMILATERQHIIMKSIVEHFNASFNDLAMDALGVSIIEKNVTNNQACKIIVHGNDLIGTNKKLGE